MFVFGPTVHTLRVGLRYVEPEIWRRIVVKSDTKLPVFARILEAAMGWEGYHLHMFDVSGILFGTLDEDTDYVIDERKVTVKQILPKVGSSLRWDYDFGDSWEQDVMVEAIEALETKAKLPICLDGQRACPPEDCGGVTGYQHLVGALRDPSDPEHADYADWVPPGYDPERFDARAATNLMRARGR